MEQCLSKLIPSNVLPSIYLILILCEGLFFLNISQCLQPNYYHILIQYDGLLHMEIERRLVKENALTVIAGVLELGDLQEASKKWHRLSK